MTLAGLHNYYEPYYGLVIMIYELMWNILPASILVNIQTSICYCVLSLSICVFRRFRNNLYIYAFHRIRMIRLYILISMHEMLIFFTSSINLSYLEDFNKKVYFFRFQYFFDPRIILSLFVYTH